jgi:hypothetical protein
MLHHEQKAVTHNRKNDSEHNRQHQGQLHKLRTALLSSAVDECGVSLIGWSHDHFSARFLGSATGQGVHDVCECSIQTITQSCKTSHC